MARHALHTGTQELTFPSLTATARNPVKPGDVVEVPEDFSHPDFVDTELPVTNSTEPLPELAAVVDAVAEAAPEAPTSPVEATDPAVDQVPVAAPEAPAAPAVEALVVVDEAPAAPATK